MELAEIVSKSDTRSARRAARSCAKPAFDMSRRRWAAGAAASIYSARKGIAPGVAERFGGQVLDTMASKLHLGAEQRPENGAQLEQHVRQYASTS